MSKKTMRAVQCWDDGRVEDLRLCEILHRHGAKATFNLNADFLAQEGRAWPRQRNIYDDFTVANHTATHPHLEAIAPDAARAEIVDGRKRLQDVFGQPVLGFAYPFGTYNRAVMELLREAGHRYARTTVNVEQCFPTQDAMAFHPNCHFLAPDFWARYARARACGVFYFWGHSYEIKTEEMWRDFEALIARISGDPLTEWAELTDLFPV